MADRIAEAQRQAERSARMGGTAGAGGSFPPVDVPASFDVDDIPDLVPIARWVIGARRRPARVGIAGSVSGAWTTLLLWSTASRSAHAAVTDPVFGRDIGFFLFDLPFFRWAQSLLAACCWPRSRSRAPATSPRRRRAARCSSPASASTWRCSPGCTCSSVAFGYQLDKYELVYSTSGAGVGVGYTDANARFMAYDVLTFLSGLAGALLIAGAFTRWMWPLGAIVIIWFARASCSAACTPRRSSA